jgi:hypothetical protein
MQLLYQAALSPFPEPDAIAFQDSSGCNKFLKFSKSLENFVISVTLLV